LDLNIIRLAKTSGFRVSFCILKYIKDTKRYKYVYINLENRP